MRRAGAAAADPGALEQYYAPAEVARRLVVSRRTVDRWIRTGRLSASRLGRVVRVPRSSVVALVQAGALSFSGSGAAVEAAE